MPGRRNLLTFALSLMTLVMTISITAAAPISAAGSELTRPVTIANTDVNPVSTRSSDEPGRHAIHQHCADYAVATNNYTVTCYTTPANTTAVIQSIDFRAFDPNPSPELTCSAGPSTTFGPTSALQSIRSNGVIGTINRTIYLAAGETVSCSNFDSQPSGTGYGLSIDVYGYTVSLP